MKVIIACHLRAAMTSPAISFHLLHCDSQTWKEGQGLQSPVSSFPLAYVSLVVASDVIWFKQNLFHIHKKCTENRTVCP